MHVKMHLNYALGIFVVGGIVEMNTYSHEKRFFKKYMFMWGNFRNDVDSWLMIMIHPKFIKIYGL